MKYIELHIIQSLPPSCINRDDLNQPKTAVYGAVERIRVSGQSWKRAVKEYFSETLPHLAQGIRTRHLQALMEPEITKAGLNPALATVVANILSTVEKERVTTVVYLSPGEISAIVTELSTLGLPTTGDIKETKLAEKAVLKAIKTYQLADAADIALFGRMFANHPTANVDGCSYFNHAISTHAASSESDFFTAMDEFNKQDSGAGMMGTIEFSAGVIYRYVCLNVQELRDNFPSVTKEAIQKFLEAAILAIPQAKRTTLNGQTTPTYVLALASEKGQNQQLCEAFESPIKSDSGYLEPSIEALVQTYQAKAAAGFIAPVFVGAINTSKLKPVIPQYTLEELTKTIADKCVP